MISIALASSQTVDAHFNPDEHTVRFAIVSEPQTYDGTPKHVMVTPDDVTAPYSLTYIKPDGTVLAKFSGLTGRSMPAGPVNVGTYGVGVAVDDPETSFGSAAATLVITPKPVTFTFSNLSFVHDGTPRTATVIASDPAATFTAELTKGPDVGSYPVSATAHGNYTGTGSDTLVITPDPRENVSATLVVSPASATAPGTTKVSWTTAHASAVAVTGPGLSEQTERVGTATVAGLAAGEYTYTLTAEGQGGPVTETASFSVLPARRSQTVSAEPSLTSAAPGTKITITASGGKTGYVWSGPDSSQADVASFVMPAAARQGDRFVISVYAPAGTVGSGAEAVPYEQSNLASVVLTATSADPTLSWTTPAPIRYGTALGPLQLAAKADIAGSFSYSPVAGTVLPVGAHPVRADFRPAVGGWNTATATVVQVVTPAPLIVTASDATREFGQPNPVFALTYAGFVAGEEATVLAQRPTVACAAQATAPVGRYALTPSGGSAANYELAYVPGVLRITPKPVTFTGPGDLVVTYDGAPKPAAVAASDSAATFDVTYVGRSSTAYGPSTEAPIAAGSYTYTASATGNYSGSATWRLTIEKATPRISWSTSNPITYGTPLGAAQLNAAAELPGTLTYSPGANAILPAGAHPLHVLFAPMDPANVNAASASVPLEVTPAVLLAVASDAVRAYGAPNPAFAVSYAGFVNGDTSASIVPPVLATAATEASSVGRYPITLTGGAAANYVLSLQPGMLTIVPKPVSFAFANLEAAYDGSVKSAAVTPSDPAATYAADLVRGPDAGTYTVTAAATGNFAGSGEATLSISPASQAVTISPETATASVGMSLAFTAAGGQGRYAWTSATPMAGSPAGASAAFASPGTYHVSVQDLGNANYRPSNTATAMVTVLPARAVTAFEPVASSYTVLDPASPVHGQTYGRIWQTGDRWHAYLGRSGVRFRVQGEGWPAIDRVEIQAQPPSGDWYVLATQAPPPGTRRANEVVSVMLGDTVPEQPLVPLSFQQGRAATGEWRFRARVRDAVGVWSESSEPVGVEVALPIVTKSVSGQTVPPAGPVGEWFTASPLQTYAIPLWIP